MYIASTDMKRVSDMARPKHLAKRVGVQDAHGWITAALLCEMGDLEGQATIDNVESKFRRTRCIRQECSVEAPRLLLKSDKNT